MTQSYRFGVVQATAWRIVAELYRRHFGTHDLRLLERHPGSSVNGQLCLMMDAADHDRADTACVTFNFGGATGTCDLQRGDHVQFVGLDYVTPMLVDDPIGVINRLEAMLGLPRTAGLPSSSETVLTVRAIAQVLGHEWLSRGDLRTTLGWVDASVACSVPQWTRVFGEDLSYLADAVNKGAMPWQLAHARLARYVAVHADSHDGPMIGCDRRFVAFDMKAGTLVYGDTHRTAAPTSLLDAYRRDHRRLGGLVNGMLAHLGR